MNVGWWPRLLLAISREGGALNLFKEQVKLVHPFPNFSDCLISCYFPHTLADLPCLYFSCSTLLSFLEIFLNSLCLIHPPHTLSHLDNLDVLRNSWLILEEAIDIP